MDNENYYESLLLEAEMTPLQGRVQTLEDDSEGLLQRPYDQISQQLSHGYKQNEKLAAAARPSSPRPSPTAWHGSWSRPPARRPRATSSM